MIGTKYGPASSGRPSWAANAPAGADEIGSDDRAGRGAPHDQPDRRGTSAVRVHVRGRVARQLVRGVAEPDEERPEEQQRQRYADDRHRRRRRRRRRRSRSRSHSPIRRPRRIMSRGEDAAPTGRAEHDGRAGRAAQERRSRRGSCATIVATVTAAMWPVLPSATPATSDRRVRRRSSSRRAAGTVAVSASCRDDRGASQSRPSVRTSTRAARSGPSSAGSGVGASAISTNRQNAFASRICSGVRAPDTQRVRRARRRPRRSAPATSRR